MRCRVRSTIVLGALAAGLHVSSLSISGQSGTPSAPTPTPAPSTPAPSTPAPSAPTGSGTPSTRTDKDPIVPTGVPLPPDYLIGAQDILSVVFWRDRDMSIDVSVRPDGKISLPLINEVHAAGLTPEQLRQTIVTEAGKFLEDPTVSVVVREIKSRKVFITGQIGRPGEYMLGGPTTVLQLIAIAGGVTEYADTEHIALVRTENGQPVSYNINYKDLKRRKNLKQNLELKPGDTIIVP